LAQHDIGHAEAVIEELGYKSGLYDTWIRTDSNIIAKRPKMTTGEPASGGPSLCNVDAIFFLGHREIDLDAQGRADLMWFVHDAGKGFVAAHTASNAFMSWPEFGDLIGGRYDEHPWGVTEAPLVVVDPNFPGMKSFGAGGTFKDEFYQLNGFSADKTHVVLRLDTSNLDMTRRGVKPGDSYAQAYAKMYGKGRVFYSALGHAPATWDDPRVQDMYLGAIKWAMGLVDADVTPNPAATPTPTPAPAPGK
jgi:type 1 glutamine amidotransferase